MTIQEIQRRLAVRPFEPFRVLSADGNTYDVRHPKSIAMVGNGRLVAIGMEDHFVTLDLLLVTGIAAPIPNKRMKSGRAA